MEDVAGGFCPAQGARPAAVDWPRAVRLLHLSRALDELEETRLVPQRKVLYQFSARGHDLAQILLGLQLDDPHDAVCGYYRSRPMLLALGLEPTEALVSAMARSGGYSDGRDIGVVFNLPNPGGPSALPMSGGVGTQYTPTAGWAQAIRYHAEVLGQPGYDRAIAVALGGDGSVASNGFWSALGAATVGRLPMLFCIEDNGYGISVPSGVQVPGGNIAANLSGWQGLAILDGDGADPAEAAVLTAEAVDHVRDSRAPVLLRLSVPRLQGHSYQDTQGYKPQELVAREWSRDPLPRLHAHLVPALMSQAEWEGHARAVQEQVAAALARAESVPPAAPQTVTRHVRYQGEMQRMGGQHPLGYRPPAFTDSPCAEGQRINMVTAIRRVLEQEMALNPRVAVFGEDVGPKGGVHAATLGLQEKFGALRVFDTSLSEEGIIGRAVGMALAGLVPVPEIQFRKYADPAAEQLNDCATLRWRTANRFTAPIVVRMPIGYFRCGDPWHSQTNEVAFVHQPGWVVAAPSNAADAAGLLRAALRGNDPVVFLEHREMLDHPSARRPWPGDGYVLPFGRAAITRRGEDATVVTWGAMVNRCEAASEGLSVEIIDLRTLMPWDAEAVLASVRRTGRCLIVHEDLRTAGFGAEIAATVADEAFDALDAPVARLAMPDIPSPHHPALLEHVVPSVAAIRARLDELLEF
ncbi:alpha-ketoacid dehydrogenase subunit alpha/beta [Paracoccus denitrificans]|jgi:2-oxoisovalerate dehydrogenase E1 component|uniref:2-oxoglutarate dehydrogenase E1 component n=1 Tax=Paracoccus denitrificans (strain Pd 1222) TaxID=318586 RepID=A1B2G0_PARDP|nr:transketolase C-terminal domain-containing protein [Paracoccus denitrificans]ABL69704.1 Transketolase, central region [Paracoccus denitrificans PD1222]MBB4629978.1 2-oxoisovalerate dehydrogenase E1 component [Paracoccus denitrificans]MCU7431345.1 thiamine pyrophosphate-dependent enzyme [Paracoccus denitrificans]QAR25117.1 pyruvate dehydrogenase [Paracoccus denitrificans]UPV93988.1 thiamine pyrophosphate-dependent enzyme [Paracoccus denitrificans]